MSSGVLVAIVALSLVGCGGPAGPRSVANAPAAPRRATPAATTTPSPSPKLSPPPSTLHTLDPSQFDPPKGFEAEDLLVPLEGYTYVSVSEKRLETLERQLEPDKVTREVYDDVAAADIVDRDGRPVAFVVAVTVDASLAFEWIPYFRKLMDRDYGDAEKVRVGRRLLYVHLVKGIPWVDWIQGNHRVAVGGPDHDTVVGIAKVIAAGHGTKPKSA